MADTHRVMIRLSPEIYAQLAARGRSGQPLAAIIRQALIDYLAQQPEQPARAATKHPEQPEQPSDLQAQLTRAGRCWGLCRRRHLVNLDVHVPIPALEDGTQLPVERLHARL
jgi:hypothetical protein